MIDPWRKRCLMFGRDGDWFGCYPCLETYSQLSAAVFPKKVGRGCPFRYDHNSNYHPVADTSAFTAEVNRKVCLPRSDPETTGLTKFSHLNFHNDRFGRPEFNQKANFCSNYI